jgi:imidazolonepropionase-like amidohydrolase
MKVILKNAELLDATHLFEPLDVLVEDDAIVSVGKNLDEEGATVYDLSGYTLLPGIIDAHVHVAVNDGDFYDDALKAWVRSGVTTVRELGLLSSRSGESFLQWLQAHNSPAHAHVVTAGKYIDVAGGYGCGPRPENNWGIIVSSPEEAVQEVRRHAEMGCDGIKIGLRDGRMGEGKPRLPMDYVRAIAQAAREEHLFMAVHLTAADTLTALVENQCPITDAAHTPYDPIPDRVLDQMVQRGIAMVTTNGGPDKVPKLPPPLLAKFDREAFRKNAVLRCQEMRNNVGRLYRAGGTVAIGTDLGTDVEDTAADKAEFVSAVGIPIIELTQLREAGLPFQEVIKAATINGARVCGTDQTEGSVDVGKRANLIAVRGRVDDTFSALAAVPFVMNRGVIIKNELQEGAR